MHISILARLMHHMVPQVLVHCNLLTDSLYRSVQIHVYAMMHHMVPQIHVYCNLLTGFSVQIWSCWTQKVYIEQEVHSANCTCKKCCSQWFNGTIQVWMLASSCHVCWSPQANKLPTPGLLDMNSSIYTKGMACKLTPGTTQCVIFRMLSNISMCRPQSGSTAWVPSPREQFEPWECIMQYLLYQCHWQLSHAVSK